MENILVIGGGLMGSSAAWKLADRGAKVMLIEQQGEKYISGSSYGTARISRSLGPKKDVFSYAHNQTIKEIKKLIEFLNTSAPKQSYSIDEIYASSPVNYLYKREQYDEIKKLRFKKQRQDFSRASQHSSFRKFGMSIPRDTVLIREQRQYSGTINPEALIKYLRAGIEEKGGAIKYEHKVVNLIKRDGIFEADVLNLKTQETQTIKAKQVIVAAGPYIPEILKSFAPYLNRIITPKKVVLSFLQISDERYSTLTADEKKALLNGFPHFSQIGKGYYAMISKSEDGKSPIFKAGGHHRRRNIHNLDKVWTEAPQKKELKWIKKQFKKHLKMFEIQVSKKEIETVENYHCVYSESRTKNPLVTNIFNKHGSLDKDIAIIGGMSGIGAKGCLCYGNLGADLLLGKAGKPKKMYRKMLKAFANPSVNLYTRRPRSGRLF